MTDAKTQLDKDIEHVARKLLWGFRRIAGGVLRELETKGGEVLRDMKKNLREMSQEPPVEKKP